MARLSQLAGNLWIVFPPTVTIAVLFALFQQGLSLFNFTTQFFRLLLLHLNGLAKFVIMVRLTTKPRLYVNCRDFTETFFPAMKLAPVVLGYIINSQR
ncbi:hypothetical protein AGA29_17660 [Escherichia coli]|nr:hypothetical protein AGA29_17660 [Escherichia coli]